MSATYIHAAIRGADTEPPGPAPALVLPLHGFWAGVGEFRAFRARVWHSLLAHEPTQRLTYDVVDAYRLLDISFQRDSEGGYTSIGDVAALPLLILLVTGGPNNPYTGAVVQKLVEWRQLQGRPTWVYVGLAPGPLRSFLGPDASSLLALLQQAVPLSGDTREASPSTTVAPPARSRIARPRPAS